MPRPKKDEKPPASAGTGGHDFILDSSLDMLFDVLFDFCDIS